MEDNFINIDKKIEELILNGVLEISGIDMETGEVLYNFTEKLKNYDKELYDIHNNYFFQDIDALWEKGFVNINFLEDDPSVTITDKAFNIEELNKLEQNEKHSLNEVKRLLGEQS